MKSQCDKYESKLSAYMDGQLPESEMAKIAAHLEKCPACSEQLDKLRKLSDFALEFDPVFEESALDDLSHRIEDVVDDLDKTEDREKSPRRRIIPVWYRYAAVAASIAVVFFVGRMAFKDTGQIMQKHELPSPMMSPQSPQPTRDKFPETSEEIIVQKKQEIGAEEKVEGAKIKEETVETSDRDGSKGEGSSITSLEEAPKISMQKSKKAVPSPVADDEIEVVSPEKGISDKSSTRMSDLQEPEKLSVPEKTESSVKSVSIDVTGGDTDIGDDGRRDRTASPSESSVQDELGKTALDSGLMAIDSLRVLYNKAVSGTPVRTGEYSMEASSLMPTESQKDKYRGLLDSLESMPAAESSYRSLEVLYIRARANYDLYQQTGREEYLNTAVNVKNELSRMLDKYLEEDGNNSTLLNYKNEVERWKF